MSQQEAVRHFMSWVITARTRARAGDAPGAVRCLDAALEGPGNAYLMHAIDPSSPDADPLPAADEAAGQPAAPTSLPGAAGDRPWHDDPQEIARLWRWLDEQCQLPPDVAEFIERADLWPEERERMVREQGRVTTDG